MGEFLLDPFGKNHTNVGELLFEKEAISDSDASEIPKDREEFNSILF